MAIRGFLLKLLPWVKKLALCLNQVDLSDIAGLVKQFGEKWSEDQSDLFYEGIVLGVLGCLALVVFLLVMGLLLIIIFLGINACWARRPSSLEEWRTASRYMFCRDLMYPFVLVFWFIFWFNCWLASLGINGPSWVSVVCFICGMVHLWFSVLDNPVWRCVVMHFLWLCFWHWAFGELQSITYCPAWFNGLFCFGAFVVGYKGRLAVIRVKAVTHWWLNWGYYRASFSRFWANMSWKRNGGNKGS